MKKKNLETILTKKPSTLQNLLHIISNDALQNLYQEVSTSIRPEEVKDLTPMIKEIEEALESREIEFESKFNLK